MVFVRLYSWSIVSDALNMRCASWIYRLLDDSISELSHSEFCLSRSPLFCMMLLSVRHVLRAARISICEGVCDKMNE